MKPTSGKLLAFATGAVAIWLSFRLPWSAADVTPETGAGDVGLEASASGQPTSDTQSNAEIGRDVPAKPPGVSVGPVSESNHEEPLQDDTVFGSQLGADQALSTGDRALPEGRKRTRFPVSRAIQMRCDFEPSAMPRDCGELLKKLDKFAGEERDPDWAAVTEHRIVRHIHEVLPDSTIRGVECRISLCVVEVASPSGYLEIPDEPEQRQLGLYDYSIFASTRVSDQAGNRATITLRILDRRFQ